MAVGDKYRALHKRSLDDPEGFWAEQASAIDWTRRWDKVLDASKAPFYHWFAGAELNTCYNALDRHVERGRAEQVALIYDSPVTDSRKSFTYRALRDEVAKLAGAIAATGVGKGDRVIIYMPMIPEAVMAMLACARLGAVHSVVFGGFAANELATRIDDCAPKLVLTASCGIEPGRIVLYKPLLDQAIGLAHHKIPHCLVFQRPQARAPLVKGRDLDWNEAVAAAEPHDCVPVKATDPLYILYTSGTTGQPKGVVRDNGGYCVALSLVDAIPLRHRSRRGLVVRLGRGLGGRPQLHRLRPADPWRDLDPLRGQAGRHARRRRLLARDLRAQGGRAVHRADGLPRHQEGGPRGQAPQAVRPLEVPHAVPGRRARRSADHRMGAEASGRADRRSLVADRDRLGDLRQLRRARPDADQAGLLFRARAGLGHAGAGRAGQAGRQGGRSRRACGEAALAAGHVAHAVERRRAFPAGLSRGLSRLLQERAMRASSTRTATSR